MTDTPTKITVNCETGEQTIEPLTAEELTQAETDRLAYEAQEAERLQAEAEKAALEASAVSKLEALGLTAEEIAALKS
jgi:hypothetical protein